MASVVPYTINLASAATGPVLAVSPTNSVAGVGEIFKVAVTISNATDLYWYDLTLFYDTVVLDVFGLPTVQGTWFDIKGRPYDPIRLEANDTLGLVRAEIRIAGSYPGLTGNGTLLFVNFLVSTTGSSPLNLDKTRISLWNSALSPITFETRDGSFTALDISNNIIRNHSFEEGLNIFGHPRFWRLETFEGVENATVSLDSTRSVDGVNSSKIFVGPIVCLPSPCPGRPIGFAQFFHDLPPGTTFANLTDSPVGFSFSFYLEPYGEGGLGDFRVRIFGAENLAELDYVFDPDPSVSYTNQTGTIFLTFQGYQAGQWHHFARNLRADWLNTGFSLDRSLSRIQFEGLAFQPPLRSETFWLDNATLLAGPIFPGYQPPKVDFAFGPVLEDDPNVKYVDTNSNNLRDSDESIVYDSNGNGLYDTEEPEIVGTAPAVGTPLKDDPKILYLDANNNRFRDSGESIVYDNNGNQVYGIGEPIIAGAAPTPIVGLAVSFNASASYDPDPGGFITSYRWDFGDGNLPVMGKNPIVQHAFNRSATFRVVLTVRDDLGLSNVMSRAVIVSAPPPCPSCPFARLIVTPHDALVGRGILFDGTASSDPEGQPLVFTWSLGDGTVKNGAIVTHSYSLPGTYFVLLTVTDKERLTSSALTTVTVSLLDIRFMKSSALTLFVKNSGQTTQGISANVINVGNVPVYAYATFTILSDREGFNLGLSSSVQQLDVRETYEFSVTFNQPEARGRFLVLLTLYVATENLTPGSSEWTVSDSINLAYRVIG